MEPTQTEETTIESIVQARIKYENLISSWHIELQKDADQFRSALARLNTVDTRLIAKPWTPERYTIDEQLAQFDAVCQIVPQNFDDGVRIFMGAQGALIHLMRKLGKQSGRVQIEILRRYAQIVQGYESKPDPTRSGKSIFIAFNDPRHLTTTDMEQFQNPDNLVGKCFKLLDINNNSKRYEIVGYRRSGDDQTGIQYEVSWDGGDEPIVINADEMMCMLPFTRLEKKQ